MAIDLLNLETRQMLLKEIKGDENKRRKAESLRRFEVYRERQSRFIVDKLKTEFSESTVNEMRKITSINLCPRIIDQMASVYQTPPERHFSNQSGEATDAEKQQLDKIYELSKANVKMLYANRYFKLNDQVILQVIPRDGKLVIRPLLPHMVDVVPDEFNPEEKAFCYIISVFDKFEFLSPTTSGGDLANPRRGGGYSQRSQELLDGVNQNIADSEDYKKAAERYEVWTNDLNFIMDGNGNILTDDVVNPIGKLPFVDISVEKDFEFWVRRGNGIVDFAIDFGAQLSDLANIMRLQGYAQPIIAADKIPQNMVIGPNQVLFLELDPNRPELTPRFEFANPGSDLKSGIDFLETTLRLFLTSKGVDPKTISGTLEAKSFSSGVERLLSMIEKFEASRSDIELMRWAEERIFELFKTWSNLYQGTEFLMPELQGGQVRDDLRLHIKYVEPQSVQTKDETENSVIKLLDKGLMTKRDALMKLYGVSAETAETMLDEIKQEKVINVPVLVSSSSDDDDEQQEAVQ